MGLGGYQALKDFYRSAEPFQPASEEELEAKGANHVVELYRQAIAVTEKKMWDESVTDWVDLYQQLYQEQEALLQACGAGERHHITVVIPVADSPMHLETCLHSLLALCKAFHYGGVSDEGYEKVSVIVADDSRDQESIQKHQQLAEHYSKHGLHTRYFGLTEQLQQLDTLSAAEAEFTLGILGATDKSSFYHKGPSVMRNIAYLKLNEEQTPGQLFYFVDSDYR